MGHLQISDIDFTLADGRVLLRDVALKVGAGQVVALVGPNGTGKTTLTRLVSGDIAVTQGAVAVTGSLGVMRQFIGSIRDESTVADLLLSLASPTLRGLAERVRTAEERMYETGAEADQMAYADAVIAWGDGGGYEPDNYLDVPGKRWLEEQLIASRKAILLVSHDREVLNRAADHIATLERNSNGNTLWVHTGGWSTYREAREARIKQMAEDLRQWNEEHARLKAYVLTMRERTKQSPDLAATYNAAKTKLRKFEEAGKPEPIPLPQSVNMKLAGGRTAKRAATIDNLELTGLMNPFDCEIWLGDRVAPLGSNGSGKSHFLRLLAAGGSDPDDEHRPAGDVSPEPVAHTGTVKLGSRVRPGWFAQTHAHPEWQGTTLLDLLHRGDDHRVGLARSGAESVLAAFEGAVVAVTHDRWFARGFDRFLLFESDGNVTESAEPRWDLGRVDRSR